jgi:hypothetical protein
MAEMCRAMRTFLHDQLRTGRTSPMLVCCAAGGKELMVPLKSGGSVVDAAIFTFRSPRKDRNHVRDLSVFLDVPQARLERAWSTLPRFSPLAAQQAVAYLQDPRMRQKHGFPESACFDADGILELGGAYAWEFGRGLRFYELDIRVFGMINGLRALSGVSGVQMVYYARGAATSVVRLFQRDLGPVLPLSPPIYGLRVPEDVGDVLRSYIDRYSGTPCPSAARKNDTLCRAVLGLNTPNGHRPPATYTFALPMGPPAASTGDGEAKRLAAADISLVDRYDGKAELARACLAAASDWTDATALGELLRRLPPTNVLVWDDFRTLVSIFAANLEDAQLKRDKWATFMRRLDNVLWDEPIDGTRPRTSAVVRATRDALRWLSEQPGRAALDASGGRRQLQAVRAAALRG